MRQGQRSFDDDTTAGETGRSPGFSELIDKNKLRSLLIRQYEVTGYPIGVVDPEGRIVVAVGWQRICTAYHRANPETCKRCVASDRALVEGQVDATYSQYKCKNGLWDIAVPIKIDENYLATLFLGQFLFDDEEVDRDFFVEQAREFDFPVDDYLTALDEVPRYSRRKVAEIIAYYEEFAQFIVELASSRDALARSNRDLERKVEARSRALYESEARFRQVVQSMPVLVKAFDGEGRILFWNQACVETTGYSSEAAINDPGILAKLYPEVGAAQRMRQALFGSAPDFLREEYTLRCHNGSRRNIEWSKVSGVAPVPGWACWVVGEDVTDRVQAQRSLRKERDLFSSTITSLPGVFYLISAEGRFVNWNENLERISGYSAEQIAELSPLDLFGAAERSLVQAAIDRIFESGAGAIEATLISRQGEGRPFAFSASRAIIEGKPYLVGVGIDISERKQLEARLHDLATTDSLTGLANRRHCAELINRELARARRGQTPGALMMIDVDRFKRVNDTLGHAAGDAVLSSIATALAAELRDSDILGRLGGEEFIVFLPDSDRAAAAQIAERLRAGVERLPIDADSNAIGVTISIGLVLIPIAQNVDLERLLSAADSALYRAKAAGRNRVELAG